MPGVFNALSVAASGLSAERVRMDVIANNLANANTTRTESGGPFVRQEVVVSERGRQAAGTLGASFATFGDFSAGSAGGGAEVVGIVDDSAPPRRVYDPGHPDADERGYVTLPNVNTVTEMVDLITATRAYEANVTTVQAVKHVATRAIDILR
jgi:flagellar basal-body rod protein FlgC